MYLTGDSRHNLSERDKVNEYLATLRIEENEENIGILKNIYVYPIVYHEIRNRRQLITDVDFKAASEFSYYFSYVCEIYLPVRNSVHYICISDIEKIIDLFMSEIKLDNLIDKNIQFKTKKELKIKLKDDSIGIVKKHKTHVYREKEFAVKNWFNLYDSLFLCLDNNFNYIGDNFNSEISYISIQHLLNKDITSRNKCLDYLPMKVRTQILNIIENKRNLIKKDLIDIINIKATINEVRVNNNFIILYVRAKNIMHENDIIYKFKKPDDKKSKFVDFIKEMNVYSVDELELCQIKLTNQEVNSLIDKEYNGWYIKKRVRTKSSKSNMFSYFINNIIT